MHTQVGEMSRQLAEAAGRFAAVSADRQRLVDALRRADDSGCNDGDNDGERSGLSTTAEVAEGAEGKAEAAEAEAAALRAQVSLQALHIAALQGDLAAAVATTGARAPAAPPPAPPVRSTAPGPVRSHTGHL